MAGITNELIAPPGWWFDADSGGGNLDGDPSNNWGDGIMDLGSFVGRLLHNQVLLLLMVQI